MNTKEEIIDAMNGERRELPPPALFTQTGTVEQMDACGCRWPEANFDADRMVRLALQPSELFGFATVRIPFSIAVEAHALGCTLDEGTCSTQPAVSGSPYRTGGDIADVPPMPSPDEFLKDSWISSVLEAAEVLSTKEELFSTGAMVGPLGVVNFLAGFEEVIMGTLMEPDLVEKWLSAVTPLQEAYASRLSELCDNVMIIEEADIEMFSPDFFKETTSEHLRPVIHAAGSGSFSTLHCCGDTMEIAGDLSSLGEDCLSPEASRNMKGYVDAVDGRCRLIGAIDPVGVLLQSSESDMLASIRASVDAGFDLIGPECGVPPMTPNRKLEILAGYRDMLRSHVLYAGLRDAVVDRPAFRKAAVLDDDGLAPAVLELLHPDDGLGIVLERVSPKELHSAGIEIGIHLGGHHDGDIELPRHLLEHLYLLDEIAAGLRILVSETVEHGQGVDDDHGDRLVLGELPDLLDAIRLLIQGMDLEDQEVLHILLPPLEDLSEPLIGEPFRIDVGDTRTLRCDRAGRLQADVRLPGTGLAVEQGDAAGLDPASQETVDVLAEDGYPHRGGLIAELD